MRSPERQHREWGSLSWRSMAAMVVISGIFNFLVYADYTGNYPSSSSAAAWHVIKSAHPLPATELTECMSTWVEGWLNAKHKLSLSFPPPAPLSHWKLHVHSSALEKYEISSNACRSLMVKSSIWFRSQSIKHSLTLQPLISNVDDPVVYRIEFARTWIVDRRTSIDWVVVCLSLSAPHCPVMWSAGELEPIRVHHQQQVFTWTSIKTRWQCYSILQNILERSNEYESFAKFIKMESI